QNTTLVVKGNDHYALYKSRGRANLSFLILLLQKPHFRAQEHSTVVASIRDKISVAGLCGRSLPVFVVVHRREVSIFFIFVNPRCLPKVPHPDIRRRRGVVPGSLMLPTSRPMRTSRRSGFRLR
ncbi:hypothetical protein LINGRAHAP2_LOCUS3898, partial [Linum grandiflorum]